MRHDYWITHLAAAAAVADVRYVELPHLITRCHPSTDAV